MPPQFQNPSNPVVSTQPLLPPKRSHAFLLILTALLLAAGAFGFWYFSNPLPEEETETIAVISEFADWKTYKNEKNEYELQYPQNWEVLVNDSDSVSLRDKKYNGSLEWPGLRINTTDLLGEWANAVDAKIFDGSDGKNEVIQIHFSESGKDFYASCSLYIDKSIVQLCNQILSTFKFTKNEKFSIATESDLQAIVGQSFSAIFKPVGGARPYNWDGELTSFLYRDDSWNLKSFMNFRKIDCDNMPAQNMQCYQIYGTPSRIQSFPFEI